MKTDERDETALFSSSLFLQSSALFSLSREVCVVYICSRGIYILLEKFSRAVKNSEKHKTAKQFTSVFSKVQREHNHTFMYTIPAPPPAAAVRGARGIAAHNAPLMRKSPRASASSSFSSHSSKSNDDDDDDDDEGKGEERRKRGRREITTTMTLAWASSALVWADGCCDKARAGSMMSSEDSDAAVVPLVVGSGGRGGKISDFSNLKLLLSEIKRADFELSQMVGQLKRASDVGTDPPLESMSSVFENRESAIYNFQKNALKLDAFVDAEELTPIEAAVWDSIPQKNGGGVHTPFIVTPNEFVCALYSCVNSPDAPPSTEAALTIDMLRKGVAMGKRKDKRITADGLLLTAEDARGKVQRYLEILENSGIFNKSSGSSSDM